MTQATPDFCSTRSAGTLNTKVFSASAVTNLKKSTEHQRSAHRAKQHAVQRRLKRWLEPNIAVCNVQQENLFTLCTSNSVMCIQLRHAHAMYKVHTGSTPACKTLCNVHGILPGPLLGCSAVCAVHPPLATISAAHSATSHHRAPVLVVKET